jgi:hypothetical protein
METLIRGEKRRLDERLAPSYARSVPYAAAVITISVLLYALLIVYHTRPYDYNLSSLIRVGTTNPFYHPSALVKGTVIFTDPHSGGDGYDGQFYLYMIKDLLMNEDGIPNPFRFQRILYPVLVWIVALGQADLIPLSMIIVNLAAIALSALLLWRMIQNTNLRADYLFLYTLNVGFLIAVFYDVATPLCVALMVAAAYFFVQKHFWATAAMMALSLLTQENGMVLLAALAGWRLYKKDLKGTIILGLAVAPWAIWQGILWARYGDFAFIMSGNHFRLPLEGMIQQLSSLKLTGSWRDNLRELSVYPMMLFVIGLLIISTLEMRKKPDVFMFVLLLHGIVGISFNREQVWSSTITSSARALAGVFPFLVICYAQNRSRRMLVLVVLSALLTGIGIARIFLMPAHPFSIT